MHIVAPAPPTSRLQRLAGAMDEARAEAEDVAREAADAVEVTASVETEVPRRGGDPEPSDEAAHRHRRVLSDLL